MQWVLPGGSAKFKNPNADNSPLLEGGVLVDEGTVPSVVLDIGQFRAHLRTAPVEMWMKPKGVEVPVVSIQPDTSDGVPSPWGEGRGALPLK